MSNTSRDMILSVLLPAPVRSMHSTLPMRLPPSRSPAAWFAIKEKNGATDFVGYETTETTGVVKALLLDGAEVESATGGMTVIAPLTTMKLPAQMTMTPRTPSSMSRR